MVDDLIVGNAVPEAEQGMQMGRMISLLALGLDIPGMIVNRYCGSGVETIAIASHRIQAGQADMIIAGGTESMSLVPTMGIKTALNYDHRQGPSNLLHQYGPYSRRSLQSNSKFRAKNKICFRTNRT
jgi:acetyl-CoA acetyltransferase